MESHHKKMLVVEDNASNLFLLRYIFEKNHFKVYEAKDGLEGVNMAREVTPDIIIMDLQLPEINGLEATQRIRSYDNLRDVPIVAVTSYAMPGDRQKALAAGCNGYIEKPINTDTIVAEIDSIMQQRVHKPS